MKEAEQLLLKDAIHSAVISNRKVIVLKILLYISVFVNVSLAIVIGICL